MKGNWKVTNQLIGVKKMYAVYRMIDVGKPDHCGNREYATSYMDDSDAAERIANELNELEDKP